MPFNSSQPSPPYPENPRYSAGCEQALDLANIPLFDGNYVSTPSTENEAFQPDYSPAYTANDVQIMAVLQSLAAVFGEQNALGLELSGAVGLLGWSMGCNMLYDIAPILHLNWAPGVIRVCVAIHGGTYQYAPFNVRRSKRYLASRYKRRGLIPGGGGVTALFDRYSYRDILTNQIGRTTSEAAKLYLWAQDPSLPPPASPPSVPPDLNELKAGMRRWFLEESVARLWDYPDGINPGGPWPLQVHHGTADDIVSVRISRWLVEQMRLHNVPFDSNHFQYFETPYAGHLVSELSDESKDVMAEILAAELG